MNPDELKAAVAQMLARGASDQEIHAFVRAQGLAPRLPPGTQRPTTEPSASRAPMGAGVRQASPYGMPRTPSESTGAVALPTSVNSRQGLSAPDALRALEAGATFGFGDEINAGFRSIFGGGTYRDAVTDERSKMAAARERAPGAMAGLELAGGILPAVGMGGVNLLRGLPAAAEAAPGALKLGSRVWGGVKAGTGYGALAAAGAADPSADNTFVENLLARGQRGAVGAGVGAAFGGGLVLGGAGASRLAQSRVGSGIIDMLDNLRPGLSVREVPGGAPSLAAQVRQGAQQVWPEAAGVPRRAQKRALSVVGSRFERSGTNLDDAIVQAGTEHPYIAADLGGRPTQELLAAATAIPSRTTEGAARVLGGRAENRPIRMSRGAERELGAPPARLPQAVEEIDAVERPIINEMYETARRQSPPIKMDPQLQELLLTDEAQRVFAEAQKANRLGVALGKEQPLQPISSVSRESIEVPQTLVPPITPMRSKYGRETWQGGNPKFEGIPLDELEAHYRKQLERVEIAGRQTTDNARYWSREDGHGEMHSGKAFSGAEGRGIRAGRVAVDQAKEIEAELVGRYGGMGPDASARPGYAFAEQQPMWHSPDDLLDEGGAEGLLEMQRIPFGPFKQRAAESTDVTTLDRIVQGLGGLIEKESASPGADMLRVRNLTLLKQQFEDAIASQAPLYEGARNKFAETAQRKQALGTGSKLYRSNADPDAIAAELGTMSEPVALEARRGYQAEVAQDMRDAKYGPLLSAERRVGRNDRMRAVFGKEPTERFESNVVVPERQMQLTERTALAGSPTAARLGNMAELTGQGDIEFLTDMATSGVGSAILRSLRRAGGAGRNFLEGLNSDVAGATGDLLLAGGEGQADILKVLELLKLQRSRQGRAAARIQGGARAAANWLGQRGRD